VYDIYSGLKKDTHADVLAMAIRKLQEFRFKLTVATFLCACFEALLSSFNLTAQFSHYPLHCI